MFLEGGVMQQSIQTGSFGYYPQTFVNEDSYVVCDWEILRAQLLHQWQRLTAAEIDNAGPNRKRLARLVERKYGIASMCVENYLLNFERTMPL